MRFERLLPANSKRRAILKKFYETYIAKYSEEERRYFKWIKANEPTPIELEKQKNADFKIKPKISIVVPVYNKTQKFFEELVQSLEKKN